MIGFGWLGVILFMVIKKLKLIILLGLVVIFLAPGCRAPKQQLSKVQEEGSVCDFYFSDLGKIEIPDYKRLKLANGMVVYLMKCDRFPLINFYAKISVGKIQDPQDKLGLAEMTLDLLREGGTKNLSGDLIDIKLDRVGAEISTSISRDSGRVSGYSLKEHFSEIFSIFSQILQEPLFCQEKIHLNKVQKMARIARRNDHPRRIAEREFRRLIYGKNHPYSRIIEVETIEGINREDIVEFYQNNIGPDGMVLAVWGDFDLEKMANKVKSEFADWPRKKISELSVFEVAGKEAGEVRFFPQDHLTQSQIILGHLGITRDDPDYFTCLVLNRVLGQGWNSRFMRHLRQEKALAYSVWAGHQANFAYPGLFVAQAETGIERTQEAIDSMKQEIKRIREEKVSQEELEAAKKSVLNSSLFLFDTSDKIMRRLVRYEYYGYPQHYIEKLLKGVEAVTADDLLEAAGRHLRPEELSLFVVTTSEEIKALKASLAE